MKTHRSVLRTSARRKKSVQPSFLFARTRMTITTLAIALTLMCGTIPCTRSRAYLTTSLTAATLATALLLTLLRTQQTMETRNVLGLFSSMRTKIMVRSVRIRNAPGPSLLKGPSGMLLKSITTLSPVVLVRIWPYKAPYRTLWSMTPTSVCRWQLICWVMLAPAQITMSRLTLFIPVTSPMHKCCHGI